MNLITFKTHVNSFLFKVNLSKILNDTSSLNNHDFLLLNDDTNNKINTNVNVLNFNKQTNILSKMGYDFWYRADIPILYAYLNNPKYDYYYQIEYDCYTSWYKFFNRLKNDNSDMLATWVKNKNSVLCNFKEVNWTWWNSHNLSILDCDLLGVYFPIIRLSNKACSILKYYYEKGAEGYCEVIVSSILNKEKCKIKDIADILRYVYINHRNEDLLRYAKYYSQSIKIF